MSLITERWQSARDLPRTPDILFGGFAALFVVSAAGWLFGLTGLVAGLGVFLAWIAVSELAGFVVGQLSLIAIVSPTSVSLSGPVLVVELGLFILLAAAVLRPESSVRGLAVFAVLAAVLAGIVLTGVRVSDQLWLVSTVFIAVTGLLLYGLHRYELVALGLLDEAGSS